VEGVESQKQASPSSHRSLEISHTTRDSHIPTAAARRAGKVENQKQVSHFPIPPRDDELGFLSPERSGLRPPRQPLRGEPNTIAESRQQVKTKWKGAFPRPPAPHVSRIILYWKRKPISGSSFDWNMLLRASGVTPQRYLIVACFTGEPYASWWQAPSSRSALLRSSQEKPARERW
jgi:hypothetical protein